MKGQALVTLLFFMVIATTVTTAAILVIAVNSASGSKFQDGSVAYEIAQSGADNAVLRLLRDPSYSGEILPVGSGSATVTLTGSGTAADPYIILSVGQIGNFIKKVQVRASYNSDQELDIISQTEVF